MKCRPDRALLELPRGPLRSGSLRPSLIIVAVLAVAAYAVLVKPSSTSSSSPSVTPAVLSTSPANASTTVPINTSVLATFNEAMEASTINTSTFTLANGATAVAGAVTYTGTTALFTPTTSPLAASTLFTATITDGSKDTSGQALAQNYVWTFTTGTTSDSTAPTVNSTFPVAAGTGVPVTSIIGASFTTTMNPFSLTSSTFTLVHGPTATAGTVGYAGFTATFSPSNPLATSTVYTASITTGAKGLEGTAIAALYTWSFTTSASAASCAATAVPLGSAAGFAVLANTSVTNSGPTTVTGNLGVSPGTSVTGSPTIVDGAKYTGVASAAGTAQGDLITAYNYAAGESLCPVSVTGDIGGLTLAPGLYKSTSGLEVTGSDLVLSGSSSSIWVFQIASTLLVTAGLGVILTGGAQASNVFWQVGSSAALQSTASFFGTIMAHTAITMGTGATLEGRALSETSEVTMLSNKVTDPSA